MDPVGALQLSIFLIGSLAAAFVTGLAGFAFGLIAAAIWLYALTPEQTTSLIVAYALLVQGYAVWKLRHTLNATRLIPLIVGSAVGVPIGIVLLRWVPPGWLRVAIGALLILFSLYNLARPKLPEVKGGGRAADAGVGVLERRGWWIDRACRRLDCHLGEYAWMDARRAARRVSAHRRCHISDHPYRTRRIRHHYG